MIQALMQWAAGMLPVSIIGGLFVYFVVLAVVFRTGAWDRRWRPRG